MLVVRSDDIRRDERAVAARFVARLAARFLHALRQQHAGELDLELDGRVLLEDPVEAVVVVAEVRVPGDHELACAPRVARLAVPVRP